MSLPLLPGYTFNRNIGKNAFNKPQRFGFENAIPTELDARLRNPKFRSCATAAVRPPLGKPAWVAFDKYVLCFDAIFYETIEEVSQLEKYRFRKCKIYYYLEDDTMQIVEAKQRNSGLLQGTILKRHKFKKPRSLRDETTEFYTLNDLNVDVKLMIYGRLFQITSCDKFTRTFLTDIGVDVKDPVSEPVDPYEQQRKLIDDTTAPRKPLQRKDKLGQYLNFHPQVLRFYCLWDDTFNLYGAKRKMILLYYLDDDTVQVIEDRETNSGRSDTKVLLKRSLLPKDVEDLAKPGEMAYRTILNTSGVRGNQFHYALDNNPVQEREIEYYKDNDFDLGKIINVWGRGFLLYDCDEFTKKFYRLKYGKELVPINIPKEIKPVLQKEIFMDNVFGSPEDSIQNCYYLIPKPAKKDAVKFYIHDKYGYESRQLTFVASIVTDDIIKKSRKFVITFFLADDTMMINEPHQQNSGIMDGKQMIRCKVRKPGTEKAVLPKYYSPSDFFVGNVLHVRGEDFLLTNADEYTYDYMEKLPQIFVHSDITIIVPKMRKWLFEKCTLMKLFFQSVDANGTGFVPFDVFRRTIQDSIPDKIPEQEIITLGRNYADLDDEDLKWNEIICMAQTELRKKMYNDFDHLSLALQEYDTEKSWHFTPEELYIRLKACRIPLSTDLLKTLIYKFPTTDPNQVKYLDLLNVLNYFDNPAPESEPLANAFDINWKKKKTFKSLERINYAKFIEDMKLN